MIEPVRIPARARLNPERPDGGAPFRGELPVRQERVLRLDATAPGRRGDNAAAGFANGY